MTVLTSDRIGLMDDDELAALFLRLQERLFPDEDDGNLLQEVDRRFALPMTPRKD